MSGRTPARLMHPLCGSNLVNLVRVLRDNGGVAPWALPQAVIALGVTVARLPFTMLERGYVEWSLKRRPDMPPPIFIIGHWRSGTTHLFNILSKHDYGYVDPFAAGMPWDFIWLVATLRPLLKRMLPKERFIDSLPVEPDSPQEDEIPLANMNPLSFYHGIYFPRHFTYNFNRGVFFDDCTEREVEEWETQFRYFSRKVWLHSGKRTLLIKNPVYTSRIKAIREIWPDARFIHCVRNPYDVFASMRRFYSRLFAEFALQSYSDVDVDAAILDGYARMMDLLIEDSAFLPANRYFELRYERLSSQPLEEIERLYETLELEGFERTAPTFRRYLDGVRSYQSNRYRYAEADVAMVERKLGRFVAHWGYARPAE